MSNGGRTVVFNTRERVISNDHNRLQDMRSRALGTLTQRRCRDAYGDTSPGLSVQNGGTVGGDTPLDADIHGGLMVQPNNPTSLFIQPGTIGLIITDSPAGLDDTPYKIIDDPGITSTGVLTFTAAGASTRIDVVECQVTEVVQETDNRDVFDPATGLFTPQLVNKVLEKQLTYRVRTGTAGMGYPGHATGWLPLAIISVPSTAGDFDDCTFWDVRPLVQDRVTGNGAEWQRIYGGGISKTNLQCQDGDTFKGYALREYNGYYAGGALQRTTPTADEDFIDVSLAANRVGSESWPPALSDRFYLVALFPEGLPRWVRYTTSPGSRIPIKCRGIVCLGAKTNMVVDGFGLATNVLPPASSGLTTGSPGVVITFAGSGAGGGLLQKLTMEDDVVRYQAELFATLSNSLVNDEITWSIDPTASAGNNLFVPANVSEAEFDIRYTVNQNDQIERDLFHCNPVGSTGLGNNRIVQDLPANYVTQFAFSSQIPNVCWGTFIAPDSTGAIIATEFTLDNSPKAGGLVTSVNGIFVRSIRMRF